MVRKFERVLCLWNAGDTTCAAAGQELVRRLEEAGHDVVSSDSLDSSDLSGSSAAGRAAGEESEDTESRQTTPRRDLVILLGGDGFLMESLRRLDYPTTSVFGINFGTVGFLMNTRECLADAVQLIESGALQEEFYPVLGGTIEHAGGGRTTAAAFNDFVVERGSGQSVRLRLYLNDEPFNRYTGDGFVISSAAGSTAYNLAAGGPVLQHELDAMVLTPLYPHRAAPLHSMQFPLVLPLKSRVRIEGEETGKRSMSLLVDGQRVKDVVGVEVTDLGKRICLLKTPSYNYVRSLLRKFIGDGQ